MAHNHLIVGNGPLLDVQGCLREPGYALQPPFDYRREDIAAPKFRIKDWDYYLVNDDKYAVALTFSDLGYIGLVSASVMDFTACNFKTTSELLLFPLGKMNLPASSDTGDIHWENDRCRVHYVHLKGARRLSFYMARFDGEDDFEAEFLLDRAPRDSMVICTPWAESKTAFYYNRKILGMRAQGGFRRGGLFHAFDAHDSLGLLDWGRGVWTYDNVWYWAAAQGYQNGHVVGLNLGYGFGDTSAASENMIFVDGIAHKLGRVDFGIPKNVDGSYSYMKPWHMIDDEDRLDLTFLPSIDRVDDINVAGIVQSQQHQVFGELNGRLILDDGTTLMIEHLRGSSEHIHNRY
ncbi:MAG: DUF2804 domain-containing protein [Coriobacteriales bacterium]|nr:DUF2804 domain-containing protein [Coriobacteriales bacterium]